VFAAGLWARYKVPFWRIMSRPQDIAASLVGRPAFWLAAIALLFSWPLVRAIRNEAHLPPPRPVLGTVGEFTLVDQWGQAFGTEQLRGKVWVAQFFRANAPARTTFAKMEELQHRTRGLGDAFHLVSFAVDPDHDDRRAVARAARKHRASRRAWSFLTGSREDVRRAVGRGLAIDLDRVGPAVFVKLALIDQELRIRGFYVLEANDSVNSLLRDAGLLVNRRE
jgi:protein SCO1